MSEAPEKLWMTAEEQGWPGSFRSFRLSDLEHPEEYPAYVRADLYEQVKRERDEAIRKWEQACAMGRLQAEAAERLAGARVVTDAMVTAFIRRSSTAAGDTEACIRAGLVAALAEPAGEVEPVAKEIRAKTMADLKAKIFKAHGRVRKVGEIQSEFVKAHYDVRVDHQTDTLIATPKTTPPAGAIREALEKIIAAADAEPFTSIGHVIEHMVPEARAVLAGSAE